MAKNNKTVKRGVYLYLDGKEIKNDINSIDLEIKRLQRDIKDMTRGSEEYNRTMAKIQNLQGILKQHRQEIKGITTETKKATISVGSMVDWFNRFGGIILSVVGFLTGFTLALRAIRDERNKLEESQAGLKALTGLDDESIAWLTEQAKTLSTTMTKEGLRVRQSAAEILDAFMLVGSAKPELLGDKEALKQVTEEAMRLQAAAKDITLNEAVDSLTLSLNQYGAAADQASRFTNVLAAGSQAGSANIASQAKAIRNAGTAAASANVPIEQTVALIETLAYRGIKDEVAGTGLKKFFLVLQTGADETNPKIVGLDKALENLKNKNMDAGAIKKMFGEEGYNTASVILQNTEMVKDFTAAVTGTNVAYEQAAINSDTAQARLEQARNKMKLAAIDLGEKLNPALAVSTNMLTNVIKILPGLIDWCKEWGATLTLTLVPVVTYIGYLKAAAVYQMALNKVTKLAAMLKVLYAAAVANLSGNLTGANKILTMFNSSLVKNKTVVALATAATYLFAAAKSLLTGNLQKARIAMVAFNATCTKNVYLAVATAIAAIGVAIYKVITRTTEAEKATKDYQKQLQTERSELKKLVDAAQRAGDGTKRRKELIDEINLKYGKYLTNLLNEHSTLEDIKQAYRDINVAMQTNIAQKVLDEKMEEISRDMLDKKVDKMNNIREVLLNMLPAGQVNVITQRIDEVTQKYADAGKSAEYISKSLDYGLRNTFLKGSNVPGELRKNIKSYANIVIKEASRVKKVKDELAAFVPGVGQKNELPEVVVTGTAPKKENNDTSTTDLTDKDKFAKVEADYYRRISDIKRQYLADDKMTQEEYNRQIQDAEIQLLNNKLKVVGLEPTERQQINDQILNAQIKLKDELRKIDEKAQKEKKENQSKAAKEHFAQMDKEYQMQIEDATLYHYQNLTSEEDYYKELRLLQNKFYDAILNDVTVSEEKKNEIRKKKREQNLDDAKKNAEKEKDIERQKFDVLSNLAQDFGRALADFFTDSEVSLGDFLKEVIKMSLDALEKSLILNIAQRTIANIGELGFWGLAKAAGEIALITAAFETAKSAIGNFYTGGYTGPGNWDQPQGIVHSNEFVANRFAVANPNLRPIFDVIDVAQRTGNVGNLTAEDIAAVAGSGKNTHTVPAKASGASATTTTNDPAMVAMLIECTRALRKLKSRLDDPLVAETYVTGKRGINQAQREYKKLENNKSRNKQ
ncbi:phage tail tape measure protein [Bacteroides cellulosilyticus]|uniref:phage tail tape measure protein n=1 Tax=Bacteroides cellulosilyticus TaxID=246787 RepID=UPI00189B01BF|nr:phage tail tape measure protein [Bacteroides cellulosilyticus]